MSSWWVWWGEAFEAQKRRRRRYWPLCNFCTLDFSTNVCGTKNKKAQKWQLKWMITMTTWLSSQEVNTSATMTCSRCWTARLLSSLLSFYPPLLHTCSSFTKFVYSIFFYPKLHPLTALISFLSEEICVKLCPISSFKLRSYHNNPSWRHGNWSEVTRKCADKDPGIKPKESWEMKDVELLQQIVL